MTILNSAVARGDFETVKKLIETDGYTANYAGFFGLIDIYPLPIKVAAEHNQPEILEYLLQKGANVNGNGALYNSPIMIAHEKEFIKIVITLLTHDAKLPEWMNKTLFIKKYMYKAIEANDVTSVENLLTYSNADINTTQFNYLDFTNNTLLHTATATNATDVSFKLIEKGANIHAVNAYGQSPLYAAAKNGNEEMCKFLLEKGANPNLPGSSGETPLMVAASGNHTKLINLFIKNGVNVNEIDSEGFSALKIAAIKGNVETTSLLIESGADVHHKTHDGWTAADLAFKLGHVDVLNLLLSNGAEITKPNIDDNNIEVIEPIEINEVLTLTTDKGNFKSDVINHDNSSLFSVNHTELAPGQISTYVPEVNATLNQTIEQPVVSFG